MFAAILSLFLSGAAHTKATTPLQPRLYTGEECGISYPSNQRAECGVQEYNSCPSASCAGYVPARVEEVRIPIPLCRNPRTCSAEYQAKASSACVRPSAFRKAGKLVDWHQEGGEAIVAKCQISEEIKSCPALACGVKSFNSCQDLSKPIPKTCSLLMNRDEVAEYIEAVRGEIEMNAQIYAIQRAMYLVQAVDKHDSACFIAKWDSNEQFSPVIEELKLRFADQYGEDYFASAQDCTSSVAPSDDLSFKDLRCSVISQGDVITKLSAQDTTQDAGLRRFYSDCLSQKAYQIPEAWFLFNLSEIDRLLGDVVARGNSDMAQDLRQLKTDMESKNIGKKEVP